MILDQLPIHLFLLLTLVSSGLTIRCWTCRSDSDPKCADPFDNTTLPITDCNIQHRKHLVAFDPLRGTFGPMAATMCRKMRQKVEGVWTTIRDCAYLGSPGEGTGNEHHCLIRQGTHDIYLEYCTCNSKDGCNGSHFIRSSVGLICAIVVLPVLMFMSMGMDISIPMSMG